MFYEIYPRSFADSNNDGIGDLNGIASKLDYLKKLGVDAIWITPCYPSPQVDFGYDVSDYENIDPMYGTLQDFDRMQSAAKKRSIRIIMDYRDQPHLRPAQVVYRFALLAHFGASRLVHLAGIRKDGGPPNNWVSTCLEAPRGTSTPKTSQDYYHAFLSPDNRT